MLIVEEASLIIVLKLWDCATQTHLSGSPPTEAQFLHSNARATRLIGYCPMGPHYGLKVGWVDSVNRERPASQPAFGSLLAPARPSYSSIDQTHTNKNNTKTLPRYQDDDDQDHYMYTAPTSTTTWTFFLASFARQIWLMRRGKRADPIQTRQQWPVKRDAET